MTNQTRITQLSTHYSDLDWYGYAIRNIHPAGEPKRTELEAKYPVETSRLKENEVYWSYVQGLKEGFTFCSHADELGLKAAEDLFENT